MRLVRPESAGAGRSARIRLVLATIVLAVLGLMGWAWIDGGREPLREIVQPIPVPEQAR